MKEIQNKATLVDIEYKSAEDNSDTLHIRAYALAFNNVDSYGDVILPTAVDNFIKSEDFNRMHLCYQHKRDVVIGVIKNAGVDEKGMWIEADILPTTQGKDVQLLIKSGAVREFSIGYWVNKCRFERRDGYQYEIRVLEDIGIYEVSPVTFAANPEAVLIDAKNERENTNHNKSEAMEEKMLEMKQTMESAQKEAKAAKDAVKAMEAEVKSANDTIKEQATQIDNLDASIKAQDAVIKSMQKTMSENKTVTFEEAIKSALVENKDKIEKMFAEKQAGSSIRMEVKAGLVTTTQAYGTVVDTVVGSAPHVARAFLAAFGEEVVAGDKVAWLNGSFTNAADYVDQLTAAQDSNATTDEVIRQFGKIATRLLIPSETQDWMNVVAQWATNEAQEFIMDKVENELWNGAGADTSAATKNKIYGLKTQATTFSKVASYANANVGDVILDAVAQAKKNGFLANVAIVSFGTEAELKGVKDTAGNYIYNQLTGMFGPVRILPSAVIGDAEILVADSRCARVCRRPSVEIEITRDADLDGWKVNVRKAVQTKVKTAHKGGLIYVSNKATAISAINKA